MINHNQVIYIKDRLRTITQQDEDVRRWFPDVPSTGDNSYLTSLEEEVNTFNAFQAYNVIRLLMSDTAYLEGIKLLREYLDDNRIKL